MKPIKLDTRSYESSYGMSRNPNMSSPSTSGTTDRFITPAMRFIFACSLVHCSSSCKLLVRSVQDPDDESWMTSLSVTVDSLMEVTTPKF